MSSSSSGKPSFPLCAQKKMDGDPCRSPALPGNLFCHYHNLMGGPPPININNNDGFPTDHLYLPHLRDALSIQSAISEVCEMLLHRRIDTREAYILCYAMQIASANLARIPAPAKEPALPAASGEDSHHPPDPAPGTIQACEPPQSRPRRMRA